MLRLWDAWHEPGPNNMANTVPLMEKLRMDLARLDSVQAQQKGAAVVSSEEIGIVIGPLWKEFGEGMPQAADAISGTGPVGAEVAAGMRKAGRALLKASKRLERIR